MRVNLEKHAQLLSRLIVAMLLLITCFVVAVAAPASSLELKTTPISPTAVGISVTLAATATGFSSPEYMFKAKYTSPGGTVWQTLRAYSPTTYYYWTPTEAHDYTVIAYTREVGSAAPYTLYREYPLKVNPAVSSLNVFYSPFSPVETNVPITFSPTAVGGGTLEYSYKAKYLSGGSYVWQTLRGMSPVSDFTWTPTEAHNYIVYVYAREVGSAPNQTYTIFKEIPIVVAAPSGPGTVDLGTAGNYAILAETKITTTGVTAIVGDIAISPAALSYITGFSETLHGTYATSPIVTGQIFAANMTDPTPSNLTTAIGDMGIAYTDAAGRTNPDYTELGAGDISGMTLAPGLYKWSSGVLINTDVTLAGGPKSTWIFQIAGDLTLATGVAIVLSGGAQPENIVWQVAGQVTMEVSTSFKGIILSQTQIVMKSGAVLNGRALAKTAVTMIANYVVEPSANQPLSWLQLKSSPISPTAVGVPVKLTAIATGGKLMEYMFRAKYTGPNGSVWTTLQEYSTSAVCTWRPTEAHVYTVIAYVRELGLTTWVPYSLYREYILTVNPAVSDLSIKITPGSPSATGVPVTFSITPVGGGTVEYQMKVKYLQGSTYIWETIRDYSKVSKIIWTPSAAHDYIVYIYARDVGAGVPYTVYKLYPYTVTH
ncbi:MAG: ice-binding family protein [bacterium]